MTDLACPDRRGALALLGTATVAGVLAAPAALGAAVRATAPDLATPAGQARAYMMMRGALDERVVIGCVSGRYYGVVDAEPKPLFGVVAATFARYRPHPEGGWEAVTAEQAYFTDLDQGRVLTDYRNPYTGETVEVPVTSSRPAATHILPDLEMRLARPVPGLTFEHHVLPVEARGDDVWFTEETRTSMAAPGAAPFRYAETTTLHASRAALARAGAMRVPCDTSFTNFVGWRPWLKMGDRPGHMTAVGTGRYGVPIDALPAEWLRATRERRPELLRDPGAVLAPVWNAR